MSYLVRLKKDARKFYQALSADDQDRIDKSLDGLAKDPFAGKKLHGKWNGLHAIRVWPYRIIYEIKKHECIVMIIRIGRRQDVYQ